MGSSPTTRGCSADRARSDAEALGVGAREAAVPGDRRAGGRLEDARAVAPLEVDHAAQRGHRLAGHELEAAATLAGRGSRADRDVGGAGPDEVPPAVVDGVQILPA